MIEAFPKEVLAECARLMAVNVAHYRSKYGELPLEESIAMMNVEDLPPETAKLVANGMETLLGVLGMLMGSGDEPEGAVH